MIWTLYFLQVNLYLVLFYCFYRLVLDRETYFTFNRVFLVGSAFLSLVIPFLRIEWLTKQDAAQQIYTGVDQVNAFVENISFAPQVVEGPTWPQYIALLYVLGVSVLLIRFFLQLVILNVAMQQQIKGSAYSFFGIKKVDPTLPESDIIDAHEDLHVKQYHSFDVLFFEILSILFWFNPIVYVYKRAIKNIHEYLADQEAVNVKGDVDAYSILLLSKAFNVNPQVLTNNFYTKSMVKKRIAMLYKKRSKKVAILKYGLTVPLFGFAILLSSSTIRENKQLKEVANAIPLEVDLLLKQVHSVTTPHAPVHFSDGGTLLKQFIINELSNDQLEEGHESVLKFQVKGGKLIASSAYSDYQIINSDVTAKILKTFNFSVLEDGAYILPIYSELNVHSVPPPIVVPNGSTLISALVLNKLAEDADSFTVIAPPVGNVPASPNKAPLSAQTEINDILDPAALEDARRRLGGAVADNTNTVFSERMPEYPGGNRKLQEYLSANIDYPIAAINAHKTGVVLVNFTIEKDGSIDNIHVDKRLGYGLDEEAMRVVASFDKWKPASQNGKAVRVKHQIPVSFKLKN